MKDHKRLTLTETGKPAIKKKRYVYHDQLQFLLPYVRGNTNTSSNIEPITGSEGNDELNVTQTESTTGDQIQSQLDGDAMPSTSAGPCKRKGKQESRTNKKTANERSVASSAQHLTAILSESLALQKEERQADIYGHKAFMMSFVPILNTLPFHTAMLARLRISEIINELAGNIHSSTTSEKSTTAPATPASNDTDSSQDFHISDYLNL